VNRLRSFAYEGVTEKDAVVACIGCYAVVAARVRLRERVRAAWNSRSLEGHCHGAAQLPLLHHVPTHACMANQTVNGANQAGNGIVATTMCDADMYRR
jgi:hypothetical protein